jgi:hypothetical protein
MGFKMVFAQLSFTIRALKLSFKAVIHEVIFLVDYPLFTQVALNFLLIAILKMLLNVWILELFGALRALEFVVIKSIQDKPNHFGLLVNTAAVWTIIVFVLPFVNAGLAVELFALCTADWLVNNV